MVGDRAARIRTTENVVQRSRQTRWLSDDVMRRPRSFSLEFIAILLSNFSLRVSRAVTLGVKEKAASY
jgi:hypothetical protein